MIAIKSVFEPQVVSLPLDRILPTRDVKATDRMFGKFKMVLATIPHMGLIEPLAVYPCRGRAGHYVLLDGHLRVRALRELGHTEAPCMIATEDDPFTYNDKVNRLSAIQENRMIVAAIEQGVSADEIARTLSVDVVKIRQSVNLLEGIDTHAVERLKDKPITARGLRILKRLKPIRQRECVNLMINSGDYSGAYAEALLMSTPTDLLVNPEKPKLAVKLKPEAIAELQREMEALEKDFGLYQERYGENTLTLNVVQRYVQRLLKNTSVKRYLMKNFPELHEELAVVASMESI
jgi:ParB-like chromosome segregation protein Spo0J